jgi:NTE family protein
MSCSSPGRQTCSFFLHDAVNPDARRAILEYAYRTTKERIARWIGRHRDREERLGWSAG